MRTFKAEFNRWVLVRTARRWNRLISSVLCHAHEKGIITSVQLHTLAHEFDPTTDGRVGKLGAVDVARPESEQYAAYPRFMLPAGPHRKYPLPELPNRRKGDRGE